MTDNAINALDQRITEYELLYSDMLSKFKINAAVTHRHTEEMRTLYNEINELKKIVAEQPTYRLRELTASNDVTHDKIRKNLDLIIDLKENIAHEFGEIETKIKEDIKKDLVSKFTIASVLVGIIFTLVSVIYYDARTDLNELKAQISSK